MDSVFRLILDCMFIALRNATDVKFTKVRLISTGIVLFIFLSKAHAQLTYKELKVQYDSLWIFKNLQIIPVRFKGGEGGPLPGHAISSKPLLLEEALKKNKIKLQEMQYEKGADVNWLQVTNHSKQDVVIQSGEILDGGKQDRMVAETQIITPGSTDYVHVYCVEKRRWEDKPKGFKTAGVANSELQKTMNVKGRQAEVWKEIDRQFAVNNKKSETYSYLELYNNNTKDDSDYIRYFMKKYSETDSIFAGFIFLTANKIINTELFSTAELTNISFKNMLTSHVQTVRKNGAPPKVPLARVTTFMDKVLIDEPGQKIYVTTHGKLQVSDGRVIHLIAYDDE
ncbi:DUF6569 family protein [Segetibacter sp.]|uniref:ARPP-1 family domain-containing protein n=1 Tax=Segetibacter sp. TaxID=2231182 RepID=UPI0026395A3C|nr:DUF6569 family protein [Segetibacter sp.]MCW3078864.1 hypothetical protein [Segetibacter sp.]